MKRLWIVLICHLIMIPLTDDAMAKSSYVGAWEGVYSNSLSSDSNCMLCHTDSLKELNGYGLDILTELDQNTSLETAIINVENTDSDNDPGGFNNIDEINNNSQPGWTDGPSNTIYNTNGELLRSNQYPPGNIQATLDPVEENQAPVAVANGSYSGNVGEPVSFSSSGSYDLDGSIESFQWSFGDGSTSNESNPTHTYSIANTYTVTLTVFDGLGATGSDSTTAVINVPPVNEPRIELSSDSLNFNQVIVDQTQSSTIEVKNVGNALLNITEISLCDGTSSEYSWSPDTPIMLNQGAGQTLTVFYSPVDQNSDKGCLEIASNDPVENIFFLNLDGTGFIPQPVVLDVDIVRFQANKRVSLKRQRLVEIKLVVRNNSTVTDEVDVMVFGAQGGLEVYNEIVTAEINKGRTMIPLPAFTPSAEGNIEWAVEILDGEPDVDKATATTRVVP